MSGEDPGESDGEPSQGTAMVSPETPEDPDTPTREEPRPILQDIGFAVLSASLMMGLLGALPILAGLLMNGVTGAAEAYHETFQFLFRGQTLATTTVAFAFLLDKFTTRKRAFALAVFIPYTVSGLLTEFSMSSSFMVVFSAFIAIFTLITWEAVDARFRDDEPFFTLNFTLERLATDGGESERER